MCLTRVRYFYTLFQAHTTHDMARARTAGSVPDRVMCLGYVFNIGWTIGFCFVKIQLGYVSDTWFLLLPNGLEVL